MDKSRKIALVNIKPDGTLWIDNQKVVMLTTEDGNMMDLSQIEVLLWPSLKLEPPSTDLRKMLVQWNVSRFLELLAIRPLPQTLFVADLPSAGSRLARQSESWNPDWDLPQALDAYQKSFGDAAATSEEHLADASKPENPENS